MRKDDPQAGDKVRSPSLGEGAIFGGGDLSSVAPSEVWPAAPAACGLLLSMPTVIRDLVGLFLGRNFPRRIGSKMTKSPHGEWE